VAMAQTQVYQRYAWVCCFHGNSARVKPGQNNVKPPPESIPALSYAPKLEEPCNSAVHDCANQL